jgi:hypothetical protein
LEVTAPGVPPDIFFAMFNVVQASYRPLMGCWDPQFLAEAAERAIAPMLRGLTPDTIRLVHKVIEGLTLEVPRMIDRFRLVEEMLCVTDSVELYGPHWNQHPGFAPYHRGTVTGPRGLSSIYARSRLNGSNTLRSAIHRRTLECMAAGGFLFINASVNDREPGGLQTFFEPGVHYGEYTPDNLREEASRWLRDGEGRKQIAARGRAAVQQKHLWRHRAEQILADLRSH